MTAFRVDLDGLEEQVAAMLEVERLTEAELAHLHTVVERLHVTWTGEAAIAHAEAHRQWVRGAERMREGLATIRGAAERARHSYGEAAATNLGMWGQVR